MDRRVVFPPTIDPLFPACDLIFEMTVTSVTVVFAYDLLTNQMTGCQVVIAESDVIHVQLPHAFRHVVITVL